MIDMEIVHIAIELIGFAAVLFRVGSYVGESKQMFKQLFKNQEAMNKKLIEQDKEITDIKVAVATLGRVR